MCALFARYHFLSSQSPHCTLHTTEHSSIASHGDIECACTHVVYVRECESSVCACTPFETPFVRFHDRRARTLVRIMRNECCLCTHCDRVKTSSCYYYCTHFWWFNLTHALVLSLTDWPLPITHTHTHTHGRQLTHTHIPHCAVIKIIQTAIDGQKRVYINLYLIIIRDWVCSSDIRTSLLLLMPLLPPSTVYFQLNLFNFELNLYAKVLVFLCRAFNITDVLRTIQQRWEYGSSERIKNAHTHQWNEEIVFNSRSKLRRWLLLQWTHYTFAQRT